MFLAFARPPVGVIGKKATANIIFSFTKKGLSLPRGGDDKQLRLPCARMRTTPVCVILHQGTAREHSHCCHLIVLSAHIGGTAGQEYSRFLVAACQLSVESGFTPEIISVFRSGR